MAITVELMGELYAIWSGKNWEFPTPKIENETFESLCRLLDQLTSEQQELALKLTKAYSRYSFTEYQGLLITAFSKITASHLEGMQQVVLAPLVDKGDNSLRRSKSGHTLPYAAEHIAALATGELSTKKITALSGTDTIEGKISNDTPTLIIFLDDFIGSGDTAKAIVRNWQSRIYKKDRILVVSLVAMEHAVQLLSGYNIEVLCADIIRKGIAQNTDIADKDVAYQIIDSLEAELDIQDDQRRGYKQSEALISMIRTPDNTFPLYWCPKRKDGTPWPAPFPRPF